MRKIVKATKSRAEKVQEAWDYFIGFSPTAEHRAQFVDVLVEFKGQLLNCPASTRTNFHCCYPGGLLVHSRNVHRMMLRLYKALTRVKVIPEDVQDSMLVIAAFHDLGKVGDGKEPYYIPKDSDWHNRQGIMYEVNPNCMQMETPQLSIYLLQKMGFELTDDEFNAIMYHDGTFTPLGMGIRSHPPRPLTLITHWADLWSTMVTEKGKRGF